jgi:hypothetical protein
MRLTVNWSITRNFPKVKMLSLAAESMPDGDEWLVRIRSRLSNYEPKDWPPKADLLIAVQTLDELRKQVFDSSKLEV